MPKLKQAGKQFRGPCPVHHGDGENFSVDAVSGMAYCHSQCQRGWDVFALEMDLAGADFVKAKAAVFEAVGRPKPAWQERDIHAVYDYTDAAGTLLYQVVRKAGKKFMQRRPMVGGKWSWGLGGVTPVPFQLPLVVSAARVALVEGEKDAMNLTRAGLLATCNNGGAENFSAVLAPHFTGKEVLVFPDNDESGRKHALKVAAMLTPHAAVVKVIEIPGLPLKGDVSDFLQKGGTVEQLDRLAEDAERWTPEWRFITDIPSEEDKYVRTFSQYLEETGGMDGFWTAPIAEGVPTPFAQLSADLCGGMRAGEVYVLGANQGAGKTSLALQFAIHALKQNRGVLLFSMEMGWRDVFQRMVAIEARVNLNDFRALQKSAPTGEAMRDMVFNLRRYTWELTEKPLIVSTRGRVTPEYLVRESKRLMERQKIHLVVVDHMQLMGATGNVRGDYEKFTAISRAVKETAMELRVPVLLVSQTSRNNSHEKRLELDVDDLRGSGAIEEDAAAVMLLYLDKADRDRTMERGIFSGGPVKTWLKLGKNRYGPSGSYLPLMHFKKYTRFELLGAV
jgi:replicative DNA helicase